MTSLTQNNRLLQIETVLGGDTLLLEEMTGREAMSEPFHLDLTLLSEDANLELKHLMGTEMTIRMITASSEERYIHGHVSVFQKLRSDGGLMYYRAILRPFTAFMEHKLNCRTFQDKNRQAIIQEIASEYGPLTNLEFHISKEDPTITLTVQYNESDWNFISRLAEEAGWAYVFVHEEKKHTLMFYDNTLDCPELPIASKLEYNVVEGATTKDTISRWSESRQLVSNKVAAKTFDFKKPSSPMFVHLDSNHDMGELPPMESYLYRGAYAYKDDAVGEKFVLRHMEEHEAAAKIFYGQSNVRHMLAGHWFELTGHWELDHESIHQRKFLLLSIEHCGRNNYLEEDGKTVYTNSFECIRLKIPFRPGHQTPKPVMRGLQTAIVVGPPGEDIFCDKYGRVKIQFHWDRTGKFDDKSCCWVRVATQWAGQHFGFISMPRVGTEVLVDFLEGDPDRPIITGAVYNEANMPPWDLPTNKTQSGIATRSTKGGNFDNANALRFEDKKGSEEVWLHAEKNQCIEVENDETHEVNHDRTKTIKNNETVSIGANRTETVGANETITISGSRTESVSGNETISITGNRTENVTGNETIAITGFKNTTITQFKSETVALASTEQVGLARNLMVGGAYTIEVGAAMNTVVAGVQGLQVLMSRFVNVSEDQNTTIGGSRTETISGDDITTSQTRTHTVLKDCALIVQGRFTIEVGGASLEMRQDGTILLNGNAITIEGSTVTINGAPIKLN